MVSSNYFDYAAASPLHPDILDEMMPFFIERFYNPSSVYNDAKNISIRLSEARSMIAKVFSCRPTELVFTAGGTEANNLAIQGIMEQYKDCNIVTSSIEHDSVLMPSSKYNHKKIKVNEQGMVNLIDLEKKVDDKTVLVSVMYVNNEIGSVQPIKKISSIIKKIRSDRVKRKIDLPIYFHTDASQAGNCFSLNINSLGIDMMTVNGGKIYGPKQSAVLYRNRLVNLKPIIYGGGQEKGLRSGTENVANIIGLARAIKIAQDNHKIEHDRLLFLSNALIKNINLKVNNIKINGTKNKSPSFVHFTVMGLDNETIVMKLDELGFQVAVGSACKASNDEPSHVLKAIGMSDEDSQSSVRLSLGKNNDINSILNLSSAIEKACKF